MGKPQLARSLSLSLITESEAITPADSLQARMILFHRRELTPRDAERLKRDVIREYQPYVERIARGLARRSTDPIEDLVQVGCMGVLKALERFKPTLNVRFKTYCTYHITGEIRHYLRDKASLIKPPRALYELYYRMNQIVAQLTQQLGRAPTDLEIAEALQCPTTQVRQAFEVEKRQQILSLESFQLSSGDQGETHYVERLVDDHNEEALIHLEERLTVEHGMKGLSTPLREVVDLYYFNDLSQLEIAHQLGISQMQVSRRLRKALETMEVRLRQPRPVTLRPSRRWAGKALSRTAN